MLPQSMFSSSQSEMIRSGFCIARTFPLPDLGWALRDLLGLHRMVAGLNVSPAGTNSLHIILPWTPTIDAQDQIGRWVCDGRAMLAFGFRSCCLLCLSVAAGS
jgi:hypothetical protein